MKSTAKLAATLAFGFICSLANAQDADIVVFIEDLTLPSHSPASNFTVITESDIAEGGYSSIIDVLERNSSFRASTDSTGAKRSSAIDLRGFGETAARNIAIVLDGVPLNNPTLEAPNLGLIPLSQVTEIRLIPSGGGVLFGNGAVGGVIEISTKNQNGIYRPSYELNGGSFGFAQISAKHSLIGSDYVISGDIVEQSSDGYRHFNDSDLTAGRLEYRIDRDFDFSLSHLRSLDQRNAAGASTEAVLALDRRDSSINDRSSVNYRQAITDVKVGFNRGMNHYRGTISHRQSDQDGKYENPSYGNIQQNLDLVNSRFEISSLPAPESTLDYLAGLEFTKGKYSSLYITPFRKQSSAAVFTQFTKQLGSLSTTVGGRLQSVSDIMDNGFESKANLRAFDIGIVKSIGEIDVYARADQTFRFATLDEQSSSGSALRPQIGEELEIGLRASNFSSRVFTIWNKDEILFDANDSSQSIFGSNINVDKTHRVGADIEVTFSPWRETDVTTQIAYVDTKIKAGSFAGSEIPGVSKTQAGMTVNTNLTDTVRVNLSHRWYSSAYAITDYENDLGRHNGYTTTAASLTFIQPEWLFGFSVKNLFDVTHDSYVYDSYGTLKRTPAEPISFWLTFKYTPE